MTDAQQVDRMAVEGMLEAALRAVRSPMTMESLATAYDNAIQASRSIWDLRCAVEREP